MRLVRQALRDGAVFGLALVNDPRRAGTGLRLLLSHDVAARDGPVFERQLDYVASLGTIVDLDAALARLATGEPFDGWWFCLTYDDGKRGNYEVVWPRLVERRLPFAVFLETAQISAAAGRDNGHLTWRQCREMAASGLVTFGAHTVTHPVLAELDAATARAEMAGAKQAIEDQLGRPCHHFACPYGRPGRDFHPERDPSLARSLGFHSFLTSIRGVNHPGDDPFALKRDHVEAHWGVFQLRYFLSVR